MFAPVSGASASQLTHCDMDVSTTDSSVTTHNHSVTHDMTVMSMSDTSVQKAESSHDCCSNNNICISNCDMSMSVSMLIKTSSYSPNFTRTVALVAPVNDLIIREHTPPFRPPLSLHS